MAKSKHGKYRLKDFKHFVEVLTSGLVRHMSEESSNLALGVVSGPDCAEFRVTTGSIKESLPSVEALPCATCVSLANYRIKEAIRHHVCH